MKSKFIRNLIIILFSVLAYGFIIYKVIHFKELNSFDSNIFFSNTANFLLFIAILVLMIINWSIEALKWQKLINKIQYFSFFDSLGAVISGVTVGVFTPNRVGEIGGRIAFLDKGKRTYGVLATAIGSYAQFISTMIIGIVGFIIFLLIYPEKIMLTTIFNELIAILLFLVLCLLIWIYFNIQKAASVLLKINFFKKRSEQIQQISSVQIKSMFLILVLSILRYSVFFIQFYILLIIFNVKINLLEAFVSIGLTYLFMTIIPTTTLIELGIRGSLALFFIGIFSDNVIGIVLASIILWIINIAIPAVVGSYFLIKSGNTKTFAKQNC